MPKITLALLFSLILCALGSIPKAAAQQPGDPICPFCIISYKCCIKGNHASCIPESQNC